MIDCSKYLSFYPHKVLAIKELRLDTGMGLKEAKEAIDELFYGYALESGEDECGYLSNPAKAKPSKHMTEYNWQKQERKQRKPKRKVQKTDVPKRQVQSGGVPNIKDCVGCLALFMPVFIVLGTIFELAAEYGGTGHRGRRRRRRRW